MFHLPRYLLLAVAIACPLAPAVPGLARAGASDAARGAEQPRVLRVGPGRTLARPSDAARIARDGDLIEIDAGIYEGDAAVWTRNRLTLRGVGGRAQLRAAGAHTEGKAIWVIKGADTTVERVEFSGAAVPHRNGAGIRQEGPGLTVRECRFSGNENGILTGAHPASDIVIERSEFAGNGSGDGYSHNIYVGGVRRFTLRFSHVHGALVGHNVKSRARTSEILYNRIMDYAGGRTSYSIDLPNGGLAFVIGNVLQQGPLAENDALVAYGAEGLGPHRNEFYAANNTLVNDLPAGGRFVFLRPGAGVAWIVNNLFVGPGQILDGHAELWSNARASRGDFVDAGAHDYRLAAGAAAIGAAVNPGRVNGFDLAPSAEYVHPAQSRARPRKGRLDLGAFQYRGGAASP
ncbi:MAG: right-handed parallel beta-helix repeat-containing protein [Burkholderiales bacterium]|nr:right-handed parallel beta-helix repeat-containing protein [Burkholderiales bacterium]